MSQAKVEQYKKEKANRKKIIAKQKRQRVAASVCGVLVCAAVIGWAGYSGYNYYESKKPAETFHVSTSDIDNYISDLSTEE